MWGVTFACKSNTPHPPLRGTFSSKRRLRCGTNLKNQIPIYHTAEGQGISDLLFHRSLCDVLYRFCKGGAGGGTGTSGAGEQGTAEIGFAGRWI